jgi:hypothetical protein
LKAALSDESGDVQDAAQWALDQIQGEDDSRPRVKPRPRVRVKQRI